MEWISNFESYITNMDRTFLKIDLIMKNGFLKTVQFQTKHFSKVNNYIHRTRLDAYLIPMKFGSSFYSVLLIFGPFNFRSPYPKSVLLIFVHPIRSL